MGDRVYGRPGIWETGYIGDWVYRRLGIWGYIYNTGFVKTVDCLLYSTYWWFINYTGSHLYLYPIVLSMD